MKKENEQTPDNAFHQALQESIKGSRHAIKFIARFVSALVKVRTSNLVKIANAFETDTEQSSVYRQIQRFLKNENQVSIDYLKLLKLDGKLKILIDRTEWKFGSCWINILTLSVAYKNVVIPLLWEVVSHKGNATAARVLRSIIIFNNFCTIVIKLTFNWKRSFRSGKFALIQQGIKSFLTQSTIRRKTYD